MPNHESNYDASMSVFPVHVQKTYVSITYDKHVKEMLTVRDDDS